jgi:hypothetical protein
MKNECAMFSFIYYSYLQERVAELPLFGLTELGSVSHTETKESMSGGSTG